MKKISTIILLSALIYSLIGCADKSQENNNTAQENGWELEKRVTKKVANFYFTFPSEGYAYDNRDLLVKKCIDDLKEDCAAIELQNYNTPIKIIFLNSRKEMEEEVGYSATGWTNMWTQEIHIVANNEFTPPIKHELMHMISMTTWGYPHDDLIWINEGLATTTEKHCNGYNVGEIYRYLIENELLLSIDSLTNNFHGEPSIISYHQSAHIVEYLLTNYGLEKFKELWKKGFSSFEEIYLISFSQMEEEIKIKTIEKYPTPVNIDWDVFKKGCY
ncbi:MAG: peptidase MA family metallohydrolase [Vicingaceae bacterium]|nr:peptidase MA family metallohydrolase [Vicingaceae bacterium]